MDFSQPVGLLLVAILHFIPDVANLVGIVRALQDAVAPGSFLVVSHGLDLSDTAASDATANLEAAQVYSQLAEPVTLRTYDQIAGLFGEWELIEPGLVSASMWRPATPPACEPVPVLAGVARRPDDMSGDRT